MEPGVDGLLGLPYAIVYKSTLKYFACFCNKLSNQLFFIFVLLFPIHVAIRAILDISFFDLILLHSDFLFNGMVAVTWFPLFFLLDKHYSQEGPKIDVR